MQADLCEIVRTLIHRGRFDPTVTLDNIADNPEIVNKLRCATFDSTNDNLDIPGICAVNPKSTFSRQNFIIFLGGKMMGLFDKIKCESKSETGAPMVAEIATLQVCQPNTKPY